MVSWDSRMLAWLCTVFLPHVAVETRSALVDAHNVGGAVLFVLGLVAFCIGAGQVYASKLLRNGAVTGGIYNTSRHPQYLALSVCGLGLLLLWPRFIVLVSFVAMLFAYFLLARIEEAECEQRFGASYAVYRERTQMFLPFRLPFVERLPVLPSRGLGRWLALLALFGLAQLCAIGLGMGPQRLSVWSLFVIETPDSVYVSVARTGEAELSLIAQLAAASPAVQRMLASEPGSRFIHYVLPAEWNVPEIPMGTVAGGGHHSPAPLEPLLYRVVFTRAVLPSHPAPRGRWILLRTASRVPVGEAVIDLAKQAVVETKSPPPHLTYEGVPVPLF